MKRIVIKCGGSALDELPDSFFQELVELTKAKQWLPVIVHGGGPLISSLSKRLDLEAVFVEGLRVTTAEHLQVVEMALSGSINKQLVRKLTTSGGKAWGVSGVDGGLLKAKQLSAKLGYVGEISAVHVHVLELLLEHGYIPVVSPIAVDEAGQHYNVNADMAASAIATALKTDLIFVSDIDGIYGDELDEQGQRKVLQRVTQGEVQQMIEEKLITGGMIPKVRSALQALENGVENTVILNGKREAILKRFLHGEAPGDDDRMGGSEI